MIEVGAGKPEDVVRLREKLSGRIALATPSGVTFDEVISNFYRAPLLARELKEAGAKALMTASDKQHAMLYPAPVDFNARIAALPTVSLAGEDVGLIQRLLERGEPVRLRMEIKNKLGPVFEAANIAGEITGREHPEEIVVVGVHSVLVLMPPPLITAVFS